MPADTIQIDIKQPGHDPVSFEVTLATTIADFKQTCDLVGCGIYYKSTKRNNSDSLQEIGM